MPEENPPNTALTSRFQQMFPVLSPAEIDRVRRFGSIQTFPSGEFLYPWAMPSPART